MVLTSDAELPRSIRWLLQHTPNLAEAAPRLRGKAAAGVLPGGNLDLREGRVGGERCLWRGLTSSPAAAAP